MCNWGVLKREFTFVLAVSTEVTDIGASHHVMARPLRWEFETGEGSENIEKN